MNDSFDPYAPPKSDLEEGRHLEIDAHSRRMELRGHEGRIRFVGQVYLLAGVLAALVAIFGFFGTIWPTLFGGGGGGGGGAPGVLLLLLMDGFYAVIAALCLWVGNGLRKLDPRITMPALLTAGLSLLAIPFGTAAGGFLLYLLLSGAGRQILSREYRAVLQQTTYIQPKTFVLGWVVVGMLLGLFVLFVLGILISHI